MRYTARNLLPELRERVRRIERSPAMAHGVLPFGVGAIDRVLPGGGLARGALHEILGIGGDEEDGALAAAFAAHILGRLEGVVLWCLPRSDLYGPGLAAYGLDPERVVLVRASRDAEILWAMEEGLRALGIAAVVGEVGSLPMVASRRLQLAAEHSGITAFVLRSWREGGQAARERSLPNAAVTRWRIAALPSRPHRGEPGVGRAWWRVELMRCRGGEPASWEMPVWEMPAWEMPAWEMPAWEMPAWEMPAWEMPAWEMEVPDATDHVSLAAALADRPATPVAAEKYRRAG
jgi:protein ImuA